MLIRRALLVLLAAAAVANVVLQSHNAPRGDDIVLLRWAMEFRGEVLAPVTHPLPFPGLRPLAALAWWVGGRVDGSDGTAVQAILGGLWLVAVAAFGGWSTMRAGPRAGLATVALLLLTDRFRDLVCWRAWMTSTGEIAMLGLALCALEKRWTVLAGLLGGAACLFKEPALPVFLATSWVVYRQPVAAWIALCVGAGGFGKAVLDSAGPGLTQGDHLGNLLGYTTALVGLGWPLIGATAATTLDGAPLDKRWALPLLIGLAMPLGYQTFNPTYLGDIVCIGAGLAGGVFARAGGLRWLIVAAAIAAPSLDASIENIRWQTARNTSLRARWAEIVAAPPRAWSLADDAGDDARWLAQRLVDDLGVPAGDATDEVVPGLRVAR